MDIMDIMDIREIMDNMDMMDIMDFIEIIDLMIITAWMAMAGAVLALVYYTMLAEDAVHCLRRYLAFGRAWTCLFLSVQLDVE